MKTSKELLKELVDYLKSEKKFKTQAELSLHAGYKEQTLTQAISKKSGHQAVIDNLKIIYRDLLKNSIWDDVPKAHGKEESRDASKDYKHDDPVNIASEYQEKYIRLLEENRELYKKLLEKNKDPETVRLKRAK